MTPLEIIMLGHRMRAAQMRWPNHPERGSIEVMALEKQFDEAIAPYVEHVDAVRVAAAHQKEHDDSDPLGPHTWGGA